MSKKHKQFPTPASKVPPPIYSLLDHMKDGNEFESLVKYKAVNIDVATEIRKSLQEIKAIRNRPAICYLANVVNTGGSL